MLTTILFAASLAVAAPPGSFRGHDFGDSCSQDAGLVKVGTEGEGIQQLTVYNEIEPKLNIGPVPLTSVSYSCWSDMLMMIMVRFDIDDGGTLYGILTEHWGKPVQDNQYIPDYTWMGTIFAQLEYAHRNDSSLILIHGPLTQQWKTESKREAASQASDDL